MKQIIMYLGAPNDEQGNLSSIAKGRADKSIKEYHSRDDSKILCLGGWGAQFNTTNIAHAIYVQQYLLQKEIPKRDLLEIIKTGNTVEDATLSKPVLEEYGCKNLVVVTSDTHVPRASYIFTRVLPEFNLTFSAAKNNVSDEELNKLKMHEDKALGGLIKKGLIINDLIIK